MSKQDEIRNSFAEGILSSGEFTGAKAITKEEFLAVALEEGQTEEEALRAWESWQKTLKLIEKPN